MRRLINLLFFQSFIVKINRRDLDNYLIYALLIVPSTKKIYFFSLTLISPANEFFANTLIENILMKTHTIQKLVLITLITLSASVFAGEKINWTGPYVGVDAGYSWGRDNNLQPPGEGTVSGWFAKNKPKGGLIGINAGYDFLLNDKWLVGLGADFKTYNADEKAQQYDLADLTDLCCSIKSSVENKFSVLAKAGYLVNDKVLLYVNGGWANAQIKRSYMDTFFDYADSRKNWQDGWTMGLGGEFNFYQNIAAKIEYRYTDLGNKTVPNVFDGNWGKQLQDLHQNELTAGITYRF